MKITPKLRFEVLKDQDPRHFTVGKDTQCCQRVGGAGEEAAIDSFINPLAGVVILYYNDKVAAQSYFHYVPHDDGIILDNIEINKNSGIDQNDLDIIYAHIANVLKQQKGFKYVLCGKGYNKINNDKFETTSLENDPRYFAVEDYYTDFEPNDALDLTKFKEKVNSEDVLKKYSKGPYYSIGAFAEKYYNMVINN
jgi:hypothetical protein